ncbi:hypothetical protein G6F64_015205 [Rhizopus arrhizus]|uniref:Uncharacterized protein n=1 Tax=Rhizopus oryzae TaxID=64495 RepID=A0A9P6WS16_RHIOR|nr:hypothetical protein G6F64_015205 [Rhizopus arrhizus]
MGSPDMIDASRIYTPADIARLPLLRQSRESGLNMIYDGWLRPHTPASNIFTINSLIAMAGLTAAGFGQAAVGDCKNQHGAAAIGVQRDVPARRGRGVL